jgi:serine/threonine protein kinase
VTEKPLHLDIPSLGPDPISLAGKDRWILGSDPARADLVLPGVEIAGVHCVLALKGRALQVTDLGSDTGTQLDGVAITQCPMGTGQRLDVGHVSVWLSEDSAGAGNSLPSISGYEVEREVGRGAGGRVYLAVQTSLQRQVAIKVLAPALSHDPDLVQRFESEARAAAALGHSNVVTVFDVGSQDAVHYLSMEYMGEGSLADRLEKRGPLSWRQTLRVIADTSKALAFAESRGLVHRDIKPANLMLTENGVTKLADLGLVMDLSQDHEGGPAMGTPHFLAPEVVRGQKPSALSDLYSLGATAYQVSTGCTPFEGASSKEILRAALTTEPETPTQRDAEIPEPVSQLILNLMAKDPALRPQNAQAVLERVDQLELQLGLPQLSTSGSGRRRALILAGPVILAAAYFLWDSKQQAAPNPTPGKTENVRSTTSNTVGPSDSDPEFLFDVVEGPGVGEGEVPSADMGAEFESEAQEQLKALQELDLSDEVRIQRLREFAQTYRGSNSADQALTQAGSLEERGRSVTRAMEEAAQSLSDESDVLRGLGKWTPEAAQLLTPLQAVLTYESPLTGELAISLSDVRKEVLIGLLAQGDGFLQSILSNARGHANRGEFDQAHGALDVQIQRFQSTDSVDLSLLNSQGQAPVEALEFKSRIQELGILKAELPSLQEQWIAKTRGMDRITLGRLLGRNSGLRQELSALSLEEARVRLEAAQDSLLSEPGRGWAATFDRDLAAMQAYMHAWQSSYKSGDWSLSNTLDPRAARPNHVGISGVHSNWVSLDGVRVPFGDFLVRERDFRYLFEDRIETPLAPEEAEGLACLWRVQAVLSVMGQVQEMLVQTGDARFNEGEANAVNETLVKAKKGQTEQGMMALAVEQQTASALVAGLRAFSLKDYGAAAGYMERAFEVGRGSLLLMLLSDGTALPLGEAESKPAEASEEE